MSTAAPGIVRRGIGSNARHTEPVRQLIGKGTVCLVGSLADLLDLDLLERREKLLLIVRCQTMIGRREQTAVLFVDMLPQ